MNIVALLTAKGNNTLSRKNLLPVAGLPLLWYPASAAKKSELITHYYASSDDNDILSITSELGYTPIKRPKELAMPNSLHVDTVRHALQAMRQDNLIPDILIVLLGNTVYIRKSWIDDSIKLLQATPKATAVTPVYCEMDQHPYRARKLDGSGNLIPYFDFKGSQISTNRQDLPKNYFFCHNFWVLRIINGQLPSSGYAPWSFMGNCVKPYIVEEGFDVHQIEDIAKCEAWLTRNDIYD